MIKEIKYSGVSATPSDYECADGELEGTINMVMDEGCMHNIPQSKVVKRFAAGEQVQYIHKTAAYTHYVVRSGTNLYWMNETEESAAKRLLGNYPDMVNVTSLGNMLVVLRSSAMQYHLWKTDKYVSLGDHLPNIEIAFNLKGNPKFATLSGSEKDYLDRYAKLEFKDDSRYISNRTATWTEDEQRDNTNAIMAKLNKFVEEQGNGSGKFVMPFFVRYALRLYDDSLVCHSAPILMNPCTAGPMVLCGAELSGFSDTQRKTCMKNLDIMLVQASLVMNGLRDPEGDLQKVLPGGEWADLVKSIDVFVSKPIYTYNQGGVIKRFKSTQGMSNAFVGGIAPKNVLSGTATDSYREIAGNHPVGADCVMNGPVRFITGGSTVTDPLFVKEYVRGVTEWDFKELYKMFRAPDANRTFPQYCAELPAFDDDKQMDDIASASAFYKLCSIEPSNLTVTNNEIIVGSEYLQSLTNREVMTDDYLSHDKLMAKYPYTYNGRINLSGMMRKLFRGFLPESMMVYVGAGYTVTHSTSTTDGNFYPINMELRTGNASAVKVETYIVENGETYCVESNSVGNIARYGTDTPSSWGCYVYYPNVNATKMVITDSTGSISIALNKHDFLNGSYAFSGYGCTRYGTQNVQRPVVTNSAGVVELSNKVYSSEVNNPLFFPLGGINSVGTGEIYGICSAVRALSQGQFGQFPLYAFTSDGVWAMSVSNTGLYSTVQPVTRDVCVNPKSITQVDGAVVFATDRGVMMLEGSSSNCITDALFERWGKSLAKLPYGELVISNADCSKEQAELAPFVDFCKDSQMIYDYKNQRIILYNPAKPYSYVFSLKDKSWGMGAGGYSGSINSYPDAMAMNGQNLVNVSEYDDSASEGRKCLLWTRPIKLDQPDALKTINSVIQRGRFKSGIMQQVLWGSRNMYDWFCVSSSATERMVCFRGTPYKYFRLCVICELDKDDNLYGCTIDYDLRMQNRIR